MLVYTCFHVFSPFSAHFYPHYIIMVKGRLSPSILNVTKVRRDTRLSPGRLGDKATCSTCLSLMLAARLVSLWATRSWPSRRTTFLRHSSSSACFEESRACMERKTDQHGHSDKGTYIQPCSRVSYRGGGGGGGGGHKNISPPPPLPPEFSR